MNDLDTLLEGVIQTLQSRIKASDVSFMVRRDVWKHTNSRDLIFQYGIAVVIVGNGSARECKNLYGTEIEPLIEEAVTWHASLVRSYS